MCHCEPGSGRARNDKRFYDMHIINQAGDLSGKKVLVRCDFNVTIDEDGKILDDFKIRASLPTIKFLIENGAKIILMAHLGRPMANQKSKIKNQKFSLRPVSERLSSFLNTKVQLADDCIGPEARKTVEDLRGGEILLLENVRFYAGEKTNDDSFAKNLASLGEIYINDAFGDSHRNHASIVAITKFLPSFAGFLLQKEVEILSRVRENPERPLTVVIGGAKISTKIKLIREYFGKANHVILGGALANTVLHAQGLAIGKSFIEEEVLPEVKRLKITDTKLHMPLDVVVSTDKSGENESKVAPVGRIGDDEWILDIGPETENVFDAVIKASKTVLWNGPMGLFEIEKFSHGTKAVAEAIASCPDCFSVAGGGETTCFIENLGLTDKFNHLSTGGGAMMEFLAGDKLPGIEALK